MKYPALVLASCGALALGACAFTQPSTDTGTEMSSASSVMETPDVSYTGVIGELGVSIYMQGTHKLSLEDGRFIILESNTLDLNNYLDRNVSVTGSSRPTVEEGGIILRVQKVSPVDASSSVSSMTTTGSSLSSVSSDASSSSSSKSSVVSSAVSSRVVSSLATVSSVSSASASDAKVQTMAKANLAAANWTQKFCSRQTAFCIPVHKNWWFKSFGATSTFLEHMEVGPQEIENLNDGPLSINVVSGSISNDGQVVAQGGDTVGYRTWSNDRHIEIRGPSALSEAVRYMTQNLAASAAQ